VCCPSVNTYYTSRNVTVATSHKYSSREWALGNRVSKVMGSKVKVKGEGNAATTT